MSMRSNGAVYLANNTFLGASSDEPRCAFLVSDHLSTPTAQLPLNRPFAFDIRSNVESDPFTRKHLHADSTSVAAATHDAHQHAGRSSSDGRYVVFLASASHHHGLLDVATGHMTGFSLDAGLVLAAAWHPGCVDFPQSAHYLALLLEGGTVCIVDAASQSRGVDMECISILHSRALLAQLSGSSTQSAAIQRFPSGTMLSRACRKMASPIQIPQSADTDIIGLTFTHSTMGLPTMMLLLSRRGDVYSVKMDDATMQPAPDALTAARYSAEDGQLIRMVEKSPRRNRVAASTALVQDLNATVVRSGAPPPLCVHHVLRPLSMGESEPHGGEAVTITSALVEQREGLFVISVLHSSGTLRCYRVTERDLLTVDGRHSKCYAQLPLSSTPLVPTNTAKTYAQCVYMQQSGPLSLYRFPGNHVFLVSLPVCQHHSSGTLSWVHLTAASHSELPELSTTRHEMPPPLAARIAFDLDGYSLALSPGRVLAFPERVRCKGIPVRHAKDESPSLLQLPILSLRVGLLLKSALYATAGGLTSSTGLVAQAKPLEGLMKAVCSAHALLLGEATEEKAFQRLVEVQGDPQRLSHTLQALWSDASKQLAQSLETEFERWSAHKQTAVVEKETAYRAEVQQLRKRCADSMDRVAKLADFFWSGCTAREGTEAVYEMNRKLGKIHELVSRMEAELCLQPLKSS